MAKHAGTEPYPVQVSFLPGTGKRKAEPTVDTKLSTHTTTSAGYTSTRTNITN